MSSNGLDPNSPSSTPLWRLLLAIVAGTAVSYGLIQGTPSFLLATADGDTVQAASPLLILLQSVLGAAFGSATALVLLSWLAFFVAGLAGLKLGRIFDLPDERAMSLALILTGTGILANTVFPGAETGWVFATLVWGIVVLWQAKLSPMVGFYLLSIPFLSPELIVLTVAAGASLLMNRLDEDALS